MTIADVKKIIKDKRIELGLTIKEVADAVGVSEGTVSRWESGNIRNMKRDKIAALAKILQISPRVIMGWEDEEPQPYYLDPETARLAQELRDNPQYRALFDSTKKLKPEAIEEVKKFIDYQIAKEKGGFDE